MQKTFFRLSLTIPVAILGVAGIVFAADERLPDFSSADTLIIRSNEARMDELDDIVHFAGGFELQAKDWYLSSDQATLYGKLDDPETVEITGAPALIMVNSQIQGTYSVVNGEASRIVYERDSNSIRMEGNASLSRDGYTMAGGEIEYDIEKDLLSAGGDDGVHILINP